MVYSKNMKISRTLTFQSKGLGTDGVYILPANKRFSSSFDQWALCGSFVKTLTNSTPSKIRVTASSQPFKGAEAVVLTESNWNWVNPSFRRTESYTGFFAVARDIIKVLKGKSQCPFILYVNVKETI